MMYLRSTLLALTAAQGAAHSWLECTDYRMTTDKDAAYYNPALCHGYARCGTAQRNVAFGWDTGFNYRPTSSPTTASCQCPKSKVTNYSPRAPASTYVAGQRVCVAYPSKNHVAAACQNIQIPDQGVNIRRTLLNPTSDPPFRQYPVEYTHLNGKHVQGTEDMKGFQNCPAFCEDNERALCTLCFDLEKNLEPGQYSFQWEWNFNNMKDTYTSCWEATVVSKTSTAVKPSTIIAKTSSFKTPATIVKPPSVPVSIPTPLSMPVVEFKSSDGTLWMNGAPLVIKGANWFGFEESNSIVHGLWTSMTINDALDFLVEHDFNALRIPFSVSTVLSNPTPSKSDLVSEPTLVGKSMLDIMQVVITKAAERNLLVLLDNHRLRPSAGITDLWYDDVTGESDVIAAWKVLGTQFCGQWNVMGADLKNEPHGIAEWGTGSVKDWRLGAERLGNSVLAICPKWLIFVEGVQQNIVGDESKTNGWWGGKLQGTSSAPVRLSDPTKLVYSPHVYGPSVFLQPHFQTPNFPKNLISIWNDDFGNVPESTGHAIVVVSFISNLFILNFVYELTVTF